MKGRRDYRWILRKGIVNVADSRTNAVRLNRLNLILSLTGTIVDADAAAQDRVSSAEEALARRIRGPGQRHAWSEVRLR